MLASSHRDPAPTRSFRASAERLEDRIAPATLVGLDANDQLLVFESTGTESSIAVTVTGLQPGEHLLGIDFRPATGELFALGDSRRLYTINLDDGAATAVNATPFELPLDGTSFGFDFNPVVDRIRVVSDANQNFRLNPASGAVVDSDPNIPGTQADPPLAYLMAVDPTVTASAYANNFAGTTTTTLFGIDTGLNTLVTQDPASGLLMTRGMLGIDPADLTGFDIVTTTGSETAFAALTVGDQSGIYTIDLGSGAATFLRNVPGTVGLKGLAARHAALNFITDQIVTYKDADGDLVIIEVSQGTLRGADFQVIPSGQGLQVRTINFSDDTIDAVNEFSGARLTVKSIARNQGDGLVNIGYINATGVDLEFVRVDGDLGQIDAGNATNPAPGLGGLKVGSLGRFGLSTQSPGASFISNITGVLGPVVIRTDIDGAALQAVGPEAAIVSVQLGGSLLGRVTGDSGQIFSEGTIGLVKIGGEIQGGAGDASGTVFAINTLSKVVVEGSVRGGEGTESGQIVGTLGLGRVRIGGDLLAGTSSGAGGGGAILSDGSIERIIIRGDMVGGAANYSGSIVTNRQGSAAPGAGPIGEIIIAGSLLGGTSPFTGIFSNGTIGDVAIGEDLRGSSATTPVKIQAAGKPAPATDEEALAIASVNVGGTAKNGRILAGYSPSGIAINADVQIGRVRVAGDWVASDIVAGIQSSDPFFGDDAGAFDNNTVIVAGNTEMITSRIARIVIGGQVLGTPATVADSFGFVAQQIGALVVNRSAFLLSPAAPDNILVGASGDVRLREYNTP